MKTFDWVADCLDSSARRRGGLFCIPLLPPPLFSLSLKVGHTIFQRGRPEFARWHTQVGRGDCITFSPTRKIFPGRRRSRKEEEGKSPFPSCRRRRQISQGRASERWVMGHGLHASCPFHSPPPPPRPRGGQTLQSRAGQGMLFPWGEV